MVRVLLYHDIAGVSTHLADGFSRLGVEHSIITRSNSFQSPLGRMLVDIARVRRASRAYDVVHVNYGMNGPIACAVQNKSVLHLHGSDIRPIPQARAVPAISKVCSQFARAVIVSTPDLIPVAHDMGIQANHIPNPLVLERFRLRPGPESTARWKGLVFSAATEAKGWRSIRQILEALTEEGGFSIDVLSLGPHCGDLVEGLERACQMRAPVERDQVPSLLQEYHFVIGQQRIGIVSMAELEAMAMGLPVICKINPDYYSGYASPPPVINPVLSDWLSDLERTLGSDSTTDREKRRNWVHANHESTSVAKRFLKVYEGIA